ncbi:PGF-CTERM sorting domain-containing protein [Archaeoglobus fulgidus]|uniref:PGF-CTERM sorting domain-containing protein n=1 Tax=Archaeoglobus fulgidus TaxID=2234 RepID=UPI000B35A9BC|nr:PGF-CTERM sorting domain-containing protein [Archaeoglobus fulgidus]
MKRVGLIGLVIAALLVISATPAMAGVSVKVSVNTTYPGELTVENFSLTPTYGRVPLTINITDVYLKNTNPTTPLSGTVYLYVNGQIKNNYNCSVTQTNNTTSWMSCGIEYTITDTNQTNISVGNETDHLQNETLTLWTTQLPESHVPQIPTLDLKDDGPISVDVLKIPSLKLSDDQVNVGETVTIEANWNYYDKQDGTRRIAVVSWADYRNIRSGATIDVATLLDKSKMTISLPEDGGSNSWDFTPTEPGYYVVVAFVDDTNFSDVLVFRATPTAAEKPTVSISVSKSVVALGDYIKVGASMSTDQAVKPIAVFITGANQTEVLCSYPEPGASTVGAWTVKEACGDDEWWIQIKDRPEGVYVAKIDVGEGELRAEATAVFQVVKPKILSLDVPSQHVKGQDLVITGTTNLAKSGTKDDSGSNVAENKAYLVIKDLSGKEVFNDTLSDQVYDSTGGKVKSNAVSLIDSDGSFKFKIDYFGKYFATETGFYIAEVKIQSDSLGEYTDTETATFEVVKPELKLIADKTTVTRGDTVTFTIDTNLKINSEVKFKIDDLAFCSGDPDCDVKEKTYYVDELGDVVIKLDVNTEAPLTDYKFTAEIPGLGISTDIRVSVVKQTLDISVDRTTVPRGGDIRVTGSSTADRVYIYASDSGVFTVGDTPVPDVDLKTKGSKINTTDVPYMEPDDNDNIDFQISVNVTGVETGTYYLYFYAPANISVVDKASDPQKIIAVTVTDPQIVEVTAPSKVPYQSKFEVSVLTDPGDRDNVEVRLVLSGPNVRDTTVADWASVDTNNYFNKTVDLRDIAKNKLNLDALEPGLYVLTAELRFKQSLGGEKVDSEDKLIEILGLTFEVDVNTPVVIGDEIVVNITTDRLEAGYDKIFVTLVGTNYKVTQVATLNSEGKATVTFETYGMSAGTYKVYVRDTMDTCSETDQYTWVDEHYMLDPASELAPMYKADDDVLVIKTIELLETAPTTTTVVTTTTAVTTTTVATTTTAVETTTTEAVTTTTEAQQGGGVPGFEAVFAIAGLLAVAYLLRRK